MVISIELQLIRGNKKSRKWCTLFLLIDRVELIQMPTETSHAVETKMTCNKKTHPDAHTEHKDKLVTRPK
jgi:hypothetical protein